MVNPVDEKLTVSDSAATPEKPESSADEGVKPAVATTDGVDDVSYVWCFVLIHFYPHSFCFGYGRMKCSL